MIEFKRVVTAVDHHGKAVVHEERPLPPIVLDMMPGAEVYQIWGSSETPAVPVQEPDGELGTFFPGPGGSRFGMFRLPPDRSITQAEIDEATMGALIADAEQKVPGLVHGLEAGGFHTTQTIDYDIVIEGELWLELDDGAEVRLPAGSCVVQNGTRHAWRNRGNGPATLVFVLLGAPAA